MYASLIVRRALGARALKRELIRQQIDGHAIKVLTGVYKDIGILSNWNNVKHAARVLIRK
jgi:hypothetical protein